MKVADYVIKRLEETGAKHMFMLPGGGAMYLNDSLGRSSKIQYIPCLHEQACSIAAEAYARVNNNIGLLMVTTGPGGTNAITGVAAAYIESTPLFVVSGQVKRSDMINNQGVRQQGMQEVDIISLVKNITKYSVVVDEPNMIRYHIERALYEAMNGRKGPVWLDIPLDVQASEIDEEMLVGYTPFKIDEGFYLEKQVLQVIDILNKAERPVILAGNGIRLSNGIDCFTKLVDIMKIPILTTWNGIDLIDDNNHYFFGRPGGLGHRYANFIQQNSDCFISIGARLNLLQTGYNFDGFAREAFKIMVDIDKNELHKINVRPDLAICADAKTFIKLLLKHSNKIISKNRSNWLEYSIKMKKKYPIVLPEYYQDKEYVNTYCLIDKISEKMNSDDIYVSGSSGSCIDISMQAFKVKRGQRVFCTKGLASMGYGLPSAIGACFAANNARVICVNGDGGFVMNIQELETISHFKLPIKIFVLSNKGYGAIQATQKNLFNKHYVACNRISNLTLPNISNVSNAFKIHTVKIFSNEELENKVTEVLDYNGPVVCEVFTSIDLTAKPKQISYRREDGQMESMPLEYMNPPISNNEFYEAMLIPFFYNN